jgi:hypothetical protein
VTDPQREAVVHMLLAQREQINAILRMLVDEEPAAEQPRKKQPPPFFGDTEKTTPSER